MSRNTSPKTNSNMLLVGNGQHNSTHGNTIRTPRHTSPNMEAMSLASPSAGSSTAASSTSALTVPSSTSTAILFDNLGQAHDPGYMGALREHLAMIGESAMNKHASSKRQTALHRRYSKAASASSNGARPSALELGLASNHAAMDVPSSDSSDADDDADDYDEDEGDSNATGLTADSAARHSSSTRSRGYSVATSTTSQLSPQYATPSRRGSSASGVSPPTHSPKITLSQPASPRLASQQQSTPPSFTGGHGKRHLSFSTQVDTPSGDHRRGERLMRFSRRSSDSPSHRPSISPVAAHTSSSNASGSTSAAATIAGTAPASSASSFSRPSLSTTASSVKSAKKGDDWGFTGIVDVERQRQASSTGLQLTRGPTTTSLFGEDNILASASPSDPAAASSVSLEASNSVGSPSLSTLVEAASLSRAAKVSGSGLPNVAGHKSRAASFGSAAQSSRSLLKNPSTGDIGGTAAPANAGPHAKVPSVRKKLSPSRTRSRPSSSGSNGSSHTASPLGAFATVPGYQPQDGDRSMLSTIASGHTLVENTPTSVCLSQHPKAPVAGAKVRVSRASPRPSTSGSERSSGSTAAAAARAAAAAAAVPSRHSESHARPPPSHQTWLGAATADEKRDANIYTDVTDAEAASSLSQTSVAIAPAAAAPSSASSASTGPHELRRKMEIFAMGVRFNAFKAKRKLKRGLAQHET